MGLPNLQSLILVALQKTLRVCTLSGTVYVICCNNLLN